jgi:hypothetical protein
MLGNWAYGSKEVRLRWIYIYIYIWFPADVVAGLLWTYDPRSNGDNTRYGYIVSNNYTYFLRDRLCGQWSEYLATDPGVPSSIPGHYKKVVGLERGPLSYLKEKVSAPV